MDIKLTDIEKDNYRKVFNLTIRDDIDADFNEKINFLISTPLPTPLHKIELDTKDSILNRTTKKGYIRNVDNTDFIILFEYLSVDINRIFDNINENYNHDIVFWCLISKIVGTNIMVIGKFYLLDKMLSILDYLFLDFLTKIVRNVIRIPDIDNPLYKSILYVLSCRSKVIKEMTLNHTVIEFIKILNRNSDISIYRIYYLAYLYNTNDIINNNLLLESSTTFNNIIDNSNFRYIFELLKLVKNINLKSIRYYNNINIFNKILLININVFTYNSLNFKITDLSVTIYTCLKILLSKILEILTQFINY